MIWHIPLEGQMYDQNWKKFYDLGDYVNSRYCYIHMPMENMKDYEIDSVVIDDMCRRFNISPDIHTQLLNTKYFIKQVTTPLECVKVWLWNKINHNIYIFRINQSGEPVMISDERDHYITYEVIKYLQVGACYLFHDGFPTSRTGRWNHEDILRCINILKFIKIVKYK